MNPRSQLDIDSARTQKNYLDAIAVNAMHVANMYPLGSIGHSKYSTISNDAEDMSTALGEFLRKAREIAAEDLINGGAQK